MAMPVVKGVKSESESFAGALNIHHRSMMQDRKSMQSGTSLFLGQNLPKIRSSITDHLGIAIKYGPHPGRFLSVDGVRSSCPHSDDNGLVLPPKLAPHQVVIVPIYKNEEQLNQINEKAATIVEILKSLGISVKYDNSDNKKPGWKFSEYELKGVPIRLAIGARDLENNTIEVARRDNLTKEPFQSEGIECMCEQLLEDIQKNIYQKASISEHLNS
jgi:prolyl-tRNA synthetase